MPAGHLPEIAERRELCAFAEHIADRMRALISEIRQQAEVGARLKEDSTPVTEVDLKAESLARSLILERYPAHGVIGEEFEPLHPESEYQWTIDPIDGTQNLVNGIPTFGTLLGLRFKGQALLGVIDHPALNLRSSGGLGIGVAFNGNSVTLRDLAQDHLSAIDLIATNSISVFGDTPGGRELFRRITAIHPHARIYYDCYAHTLAICGNIAAVVEPNLKIWDLTPAEALITEAGGLFRYFNGGDEHRGPCSVYNAVFGKPRAVKIILRHLEQ